LLRKRNYERSSPSLGANPTTIKNYPAGQAAYGYYVVVDDVVTMTDQSGKTAEDAQGQTYSEKLEPSGNHQAVAARLTKKLRTALRGDRPPGFDGPGGPRGPLNYPGRGWC
jgi:hypothetical protein